MNFPVLPERERRALYWGSAILLLGLFLGKVVPAWRQWESDINSSATETITARAEARAAIRVLPAIRDSGSARRERVVELAPRILSGRTRTAAGATLAGLIAVSAARAGVQLGGVEMRSDSAVHGPFVPVLVRTDATGDLPGLLRLLADLEGGAELLSIPEWSLTQPVAGGAADQPESLRLELVVEGLAAPEEVAR